jgi:hypothetical protein
MNMKDPNATIARKFPIKILLGITVFFARGAFQYFYMENRKQSQIPPAVEPGLVKGKKEEEVVLPSFV